MRNLYDYSSKVTAGDIEALIADGAKVDHPNDRGFTSLMMASCFGYEGAAEALLIAGANINAQDKQGNTALMLACYGGQTSAVRFLLEHGADPLITDNDSNTCVQAVKTSPGLQDDVVDNILQLLSDHGVAVTTRGTDLPYYKGIPIPFGLAA
ncbi:ankyrin repeat domain-containing protein [Methylobacillus sp. Pita2]|uniref:ankyrin repeat domain-containing protein n=1 Tax=Methylobacillus sp. Pita2 TaxID=3383245 RepID=UPI0038B4A5A6